MGPLSLMMWQPSQFIVFYLKFVLVRDKSKHMKVDKLKNSNTTTRVGLLDHGEFCPTENLPSKISTTFNSAFEFIIDSLKVEFQEQM